jgi:hypothetical protein
MKTKLPNKLSNLILIALDDLRKAERSRDYKVDMYSWHQPNSVCKVCFAGSVMAFSLGTDSNTYTSPSRFAKKTMGKLFALDDVRSGDFDAAMLNMDKSVKAADKAQEATRDIVVPEYSSTNRLRFHKVMRKAAKALAKVGL